MVEFDAQEAFLILVGKIDAGFDRLADKLEDHVKDDTSKFDDVNTRLAVLETNNRLIGRILTAVAVPVVGLVVKWVSTLVGVSNP